MGEIILPHGKKYNLKGKELNIREAIAKINGVSIPQISHVALTPNI